MDDLISRKAAMDALVKEYNRRYMLGEKDGLRLAWIEGALDSVPEYKGHWIVYEVANTDEEQPIAWECSECEELVDCEYDFCPGCGADMRGEHGKKV